MLPTGVSLAPEGQRNLTCSVFASRIGAGASPTSFTRRRAERAKGPGPLPPGLSASPPFSESGRKVLPHLASAPFYLVISLYKLTKAADGTQKEEAIDEALDILAKLECRGAVECGPKGLEGFLPYVRKTAE